MIVVDGNPINYKKNTMDKIGLWFNFLKTVDERCNKAMMIIAKIRNRPPIRLWIQCMWCSAATLVCTVPTHHVSKEWRFQKHYMLGGAGYVSVIISPHSDPDFSDWFCVWLHCIQYVCFLYKIKCTEYIYKAIHILVL